MNVQTGGLLCKVWCGIVGFSIPLGHFGDDFTGSMTNQQCHSTEGQRLVNQVKGQSHQAQLTKR